MDNNEYFTEKIAPKKNNSNTGNTNNNKTLERSSDRSDKNRKGNDFRRKPKGFSESISENLSDNSVDRIANTDISTDESSPRVEIIGVRFKDVGKVYYFSPDGVEFKRGDMAVVETARGVECGEVMIANREIPESSLVSPLKKIIRKADTNDLKTIEQISKKEK